MRRIRRALAAAALAFPLLLTSCSADDVQLVLDIANELESEPVAVTGEDSELAAEALTLLKDIPAKGRAPKTGYERDQFGSGWLDTDRNGCDARNDILARDMTETTFKKGTHDCIVLTGKLDDPFTGKQISFKRGNGSSSKVQIDHLVPLSDAWQKGAQQWTKEERTEFANDPLNLLAADGPSNASKGDKDAATWLPENKEFRCHYVARQTMVKSKYGAWMTKAEHQKIEEILTSCAA